MTKTAALDFIDTSCEHLSSDGRQTNILAIGPRKCRAILRIYDTKDAESLAMQIANARGCAPYEAIAKREGRMIDLPTFSETEIREINDLGQALDDFHIDSVQLGTGVFCGTFRTLTFDDLVITRDIENYGSVNETHAPPDTTIFGFLRPGISAPKWCGIEWLVDHLLIIPSDRDFLFSIPGQYDAIQIVISNELISEIELFTDKSIRNHGAKAASMLALGSRGRRLRRWLFELFGSSTALDLLASDRFVTSRFRDRLLVELNNVVQAALGTAIEQLDGYRSRRYGLAREAQKLIEERFAEPISTQCIARDLGVSSRVLQYAFRDVLQTNPHHYICNRRLKSVRRALRERSASDATIAALALENGFSELGRFAGHYRRMFGELPSITLRS